MAKEKEKKKKGGKTVATAGILAIIAALLGVGTFGFGSGNGTGTGNAGNDNQNKDYLMQDNQKPTVVLPATVTPAEETATVIQLIEVAVTVKEDKVIYDGAEYTAKGLADLLDAQYAGKKETILVKVTMEEAVYNTVEEFKVALEGKSMKYELLE